ncbi:hypothetical protein J6590_061225 [Homalodisca vitripennis]|nr:hypothetical protein J6590_061225 [Homalodisca vitripennis]
MPLSGTGLLTPLWVVEKKSISQHSGSEGYGVESRERGQDPVTAGPLHGANWPLNVLGNRELTATSAAVNAQLRK